MLCKLVVIFVLIVKVFFGWIFIDKMVKLEVNVWLFFKWIICFFFLKVIVDCFVIIWILFLFNLVLIKVVIFLFNGGKIWGVFFMRVIFNLCFCKFFVIFKLMKFVLIMMVCFVFGVKVVIIWFKLGIFFNEKIFLVFVNFVIGGIKGFVFGDKINLL